MLPNKIDKMGGILKTIVIIGMILAIPSIIFVPFLLSHNYSVLYSMIIVYPNGIIMLAIAYQFLRLFDSLKKNKPFTYENVKILKKYRLLIFYNEYFLDY